MFLTGIAFLLMGCDENTKCYYLLYNEDTGMTVPLYYDADTTELAVKAPSRTKILADNRNVSGNIVAIQYNGNRFYVDQDYLFEKKVKGKWQRNSVNEMEFTPNETRFQKIKRACNSDVLYKIHKLQDSHYHYNSSTIWSFVMIIVFAILFIIAAIYSIPDKNDLPLSVHSNRKWKIFAFIACLGIFYFEFVNFIVLGDGYLPIEKIDADLGEFLCRYLGNFLGTIIAYIILFIGFLILFLATLFFLIGQFLLLPVLGVVISGDSHKGLLSCNYAIATVMYIGGCLAIFLNPNHSETIFYITIGIAYAIAIATSIWGCAIGKRESLIYLTFPLLYIISISAIYQIAGFFIVLISILAILCFIILGLSITKSGNKSKSGRESSTSSSTDRAYDENGSAVDITSSGAGGYDQYGNRWHKEGGNWSRD